MKTKPIYIIITLGLVIGSIGTSYASTAKGESTEVTQTHTTSHPPHDHHNTDHIKKLDESMRRKRDDEEKSH